MELTSYNDWKRSVMIGLSAKNKLGFVDGSIPKPANTSPMYQAWDRINITIISWLMKVLDAIIGRSVLYFPTARAIWLNLEERFGQASGTQVYTLTQ